MDGLSIILASMGGGPVLVDKIHRQWRLKLQPTTFPFPELWIADFSRRTELVRSNFGVLPISKHGSDPMWLVKVVSRVGRTLSPLSTGNCLAEARVFRDARQSARQWNWFPQRSIEHMAQAVRARERLQEIRMGRHPADVWNQLSIHSFAARVLRTSIRPSLPIAAV